MCWDWRPSLLKTPRRFSSSVISHPEEEESLLSCQLYEVFSTLQTFSWRTEQVLGAPSSLKHSPDGWGMADIGELLPHLHTFSPAFPESQISDPPVNPEVQGTGHVAQVWPMRRLLSWSSRCFKV